MVHCTHTFNANGQQFSVSFDNKRVLNSFIKCVDKMTSFSSNTDTIILKLREEKTNMAKDIYELEKKFNSHKEKMIELEKLIAETKKKTQIIKRTSNKFETTESNIFEGYIIHNKNNHIALEPPKGTENQEIELTPTYSQEWTPVIKGKYWNDGKYHFFPKNTKLHVEMSIEDLQEDMMKLGAVQSI